MNNRTEEDVVKRRFFLPATAALMLGGAAAAAERPIYETMGFPITQVQLAAINSADVQERSATSTLMLGGMPASPHQIAVLSPRARMGEQQIADQLAKSAQ